MRYSEAFRAKMVKKMAVPDGWSANALAEETGVPQTTLSRWLREARTLPVMDKPKSEKSKRKQWSPAEKLRVVAEASRLSGEELGAFLRREGLHEAQINEWREAAEKALSSSSKKRKAKPSAEDKRIKALEKDLRRKEKALAEASALLILKKKMEAFWEGEDGDTDDGSER